MLALLLTSLVIVVPVSAADKSDAAGSSVTTVQTKAPTVTAENVPTDHWLDVDVTGNPLYVDIEFAGAGTEEDPYKISSAAELAGLSWLLTRVSVDSYNAYCDKFYELTADIDIGAHIWDPIGSWGVKLAIHETQTDYRFKGAFEGNGHTISNLVLTGTIAAKGEGLGLFRATGGWAPIQNFDITAYVDVTMTVGFDGNKRTPEAALGVISSYCTGFKPFKNIDVYAEYKLNNFVNRPSAGGLWGEAHNLVAYDCSFNGSVTIHAVKDPTGTAYQTEFGGAYSYNENGYVDLYRVVNNADIVLHQGNANCIVAGIAAATGSKYDVYLEGCVNNGDITSYHTYRNSQGNVNIRMGGIIGDVGRYGSDSSEDVQLRGCINTGKLTAEKLGGASAVYPIIGYMEDKNYRPTVTMGEVFAAYELMGGIGDVTHMMRYYVPIRYLSEDTRPNTNDEYDEAYNAANYTHPNQILTPDSAVNFGAGIYKVEDDQATIIVNQALKAFYLAGYTMTLTYGSQTVTTIDPASFQANATYKLVLPYEEGAEVSVTVTKTAGDTTVTLVSGALTWRDVAATALTKGTGTEADPYQISTAEELAYLAVRGNTSETMDGQYYVLTADIDLGGLEWLPIGLAYDQNNFNGVLDGQNHKIKNLTLSDRYYNWGAGFFGFFNGTFKNTVFENPVFNIAADAVIAGKYLHPAAIVAGAGYGGTITNVHVVGADYTSNSAGTEYQGAFIGYLNSGTKIYDSSISGTMNITVAQKHPIAMIGGFAARVKAGTLDGCSADMDINVTVLTNDLKDTEIGVDEETGEENVPANRFVGVGGMVGYNQADAYGNKVYMNNCSSDSDINVTVDPTGTAYEYYVINAGGIVGFAGVPVNLNNQAYGYLEINNAVNSGDIVVKANGATANVAGIAGYAAPNVAGSYELKITNAYSSTGATLLVTEEGGATSVTNGFVGAQFALDTLNKVDFRVDTANGLANSGLQFNSTIDKDVVAQIVAITTSAEALAAKEAVDAEVANVEAAQAEIDMLNEELVQLEEDLILYPEDAERTQQIIDEIKADIVVAEEALKTAQAALAAAEKAYAPYNVTVEVGTAITLATTLAAAKGDADAIAAGKIMKIKSTDDLADNAFAAAIFNIKDNNRVYVAAGYVTVTIGGVSATVYGDFIYASASGIAQDIIDAGNATADQLAVLNQYVA